MIVLFGISIVVTLCYAILIAKLNMGLKSLKLFTPMPAAATIKLSIIVPFRNEERHLKVLMQSLIQQDYPKELFEIILIDDASTDASVGIVNDFIETHTEFKITLIQNKRKSNSPKKDAISGAIQVANHNWIVCTDADCITHPKWLSTISSYIQKHKTINMIVGPIAVFPEEKKISFLKRIQLDFEQLDVLSLQATTAAAFGLQQPLLNNGANLAFTKTAFNVVNGYEGNNHLASGDDHFLLEKFIRWNTRSVHYLKSKTAIVTTFAQLSWSDLFKQRKRWAAKTLSFTNKNAKLLAFLIFLENSLLVITTLSTIIYSVYVFCSIQNFLFLGVIWLLKWILDRIVLRRAAGFFSFDIPLYRYIVVAFIYPWFNVAIAFSALRGGYHWKDRFFKR